MAAPPPLLSQAHKLAKARVEEDDDRDRGESVEAGLAALAVPQMESRGHGFSVAWRTRMSVESNLQDSVYSTAMAGEALSRMQESL